MSDKRERMIGRQLHLISLDPVPRMGEHIADMGVFMRHICDDAAACLHSARCFAAATNDQIARRAVDVAEAVDAEWGA